MSSLFSFLSFPFTFRPFGSFLSHLLPLLFTLSLPVYLPINSFYPPLPSSPSLLSSVAFSFLTNSFNLISHFPSLPSFCKFLSSTITTTITTTTTTTTTSSLDSSYFSVSRMSTATHCRFSGKCPVIVLVPPSLFAVLRNANFVWVVGLALPLGFLSLVVLSLV